MDRRRLEDLFIKENLDAIISVSSQFKLWYTGIIASAGTLIVEKNSAELIIDSRYIEYASKQAKNAKVILQERDTLKNIALAKKYKRIGLEKEYVTLEQLENFKKLFPNAEFINFSGAELRIIKSKTEIENMKMAGKIALKALNELQPELQPGITEKELDRKLEFLLRKHGASKGSFDAIVVSGINGSLPHGKPSNKALAIGELITIDFGAVYNGYCSDITRTFHIGEVTDKKLLEIETILRQAQKLGVEAVKPGISTQEIDKICRDYISDHGYGKYFTHSTGHGLGIDVHELPNVNPNNNTILEPGMVITVEPGIYISNFGGIRVEDDILVTNDGYEVLSKLD